MNNMNFDQELKDFQEEFDFDFDKEIELNDDNFRPVRPNDEVFPTDPLFLPTEPYFLPEGMATFLPPAIEELRKKINFMQLLKQFRLEELKTSIQNFKDVNFFSDILIYLLTQFFLIYFYIFGGYLYIIYILIPFLNLEGKIKQDLHNIFSILLKNKYKEEELTYLINKEKEKKNTLILFNIIKVALILFITILYPIIFYKCNDMIFKWSIQNIIKLSELLRNSNYITFLLKLFSNKK